MTALTILLLILLALDLSLLLPLGLHVTYSEKDLTFSVKLWMIPLFSYPRTEKKKKPKKQKAETAAAPAKKPAKGTEFRAFIRYAIKNLIHLPAKAKVKKLRVNCLIPGGNDPFRAAMLYGAGFSAEAAVKPVLEEIFAEVNRVTYRSQVDFTATEAIVEAEGKVTIQLVYLLVPAGKLIVKFLQTVLKSSKSGGKGNDHHG